MKKLKDKKYLIGAFIVFTFLLVTGFSYAYFNVTVSGNENAKIVQVSNTTLKLKYTDTLEITANDIEPGWSTTKTITVENIGTSGVYYDIVFQNLKNTITRGEMKILGTCVSNISDSCENHMSDYPITIYETSGSEDELAFYSGNTTYIEVGEKQTYTITIEFIETGYEQNYNQGKEFSAVLGIRETGGEYIPSIENKLLIEGAGGSFVSDSNMTLNTKFMSNNIEEKLSYGNITSIEEAKSIIESKPTPDFSVFPEEDGMYAFKDLNNITYYYRGDVDNNYVNFGKEVDPATGKTYGICWRIVRINGDGSTRLIYHGVEDIYDYGRCLSSPDGIVNLYGDEESNFDYDSGSSVFNLNYDKPEYSGYMYGDMTGNTIEERLSSWRKNTHSSQAKLVVDDWYKRNFVDRLFEDDDGNLFSDYLYDGTFCGERNAVEVDLSATYEAYYYYTALRDDESIPSLLCGGMDGSLRDKRDIYTVDNTIGNGNLTYPVGLLSSDEVILAGDYSYLDGSPFWTMSPAGFESYGQDAFNGVFLGGFEMDTTDEVFESNELRPVINLKHGVYIEYGDGTKEHPYHLTLRRKPIASMPS